MYDSEGMQACHRLGCLQRPLVPGVSVDITLLLDVRLQVSVNLILQDQHFGLGIPVYQPGYEGI